MIRATMTGVTLYMVLTCLAPSGQGAVLPPDPNNAALLYYQAGIERLRLGEPEDFWRAEQGDAPPDKVAREFINRSECRPVIELLNAATEIPACDWGLTPSGRWSVGHFATTLRFLGIWLSVDARVQAADGHYREAFETALRLRRFARHIGDDVFGMWTMAETLDAKAFALVQDVLGWMPPDAAMLTWLDLQLDQQTGAPWRPREALASWRDMEIESWRASPDVYEHWKTVDLRAMTDRVAAAELESLAESEFLERMRTAYNTFLDSAVDILESDRSYQDMYARITELIEQAHADGKAGSPIAFMYSCVDPVDDYYAMHINAKARANAVKAALDVYRTKAETGRLPQAFPEGLPGDPYSGKDFAYRITEEGFTLRCRVDAINYSGGPRRFDFKVPE